MAGAEIIEVAYGINVKPQDDPYIWIAEHALESVSATANPGSYLVDVLPIRMSHDIHRTLSALTTYLVKYLPEWFPGAHFQKEAKMWRISIMKTLHEPFNTVKDRIVSRIPIWTKLLYAQDVEVTGNANNCVMTALLESRSFHAAEDKDYMESVIREAVGSMYSGSYGGHRVCLCTHSTIHSAGADTVRGKIPHDILSAETSLPNRQSPLWAPFCWRWSSILRFRPKLSARSTRYALVVFQTFPITPIFLT
jgi:hypothetical protein